MKAFITGIAGFAGTHLTEHLRACGDEVLGSTQQGAAGTVRWEIPQSLSSEALVRVQQFAPDVIYHLAAMSKAEDCGKESATPQATAVNFVGTERVLQLATTLPSQPRVVFVSSSYVYPAVDSLVPLPETTPAAPTNGYGHSKLAAEDLLRTYVQERGLRGVIARAFQHTGPRQLPRFMLPEWCAQFVGGTSPVTMHNSEAWIDLADVRDVVRAYRLLATQGVPGEAYNVGSGQAQRSGDIFLALRAIADPTRPFQVTKQQLKRGPIADISKIAAATNWRPQIPLDQTIRDTLASLRA